MPVKAIPKLSVPRNGLGAFVAPCHKVVLQYCNWGGSSKGMRSLLTSNAIKQVTASKPGIYFEVVRKVGHPMLKFHYNNDTVREVNVANLDINGVVNKIKEHSQQSGDELFKFNHKVMSINDSVRGVWSPMHTTKNNRFRI